MQCTSRASVRSHSTLAIPCPDHAAAQTVQQVIGVDKELRPHDVHKELRIDDGADGTVLHVYVAQLTQHDARHDTSAPASRAERVSRGCSAHPAHDAGVPAQRRRCRYRRRRTARAGRDRRRGVAARETRRRCGAMAQALGPGPRAPCIASAARTPPSWPAACGASAAPCIP